jgi:hypothetical protein
LESEYSTTSVAISGFLFKIYKTRKYDFQLFKEKRDSWCHVFQVSTHVGRVWLPGLDLARIGPAIFGMFGYLG